MHTIFRKVMPVLAATCLLLAALAGLAMAQSHAAGSFNIEPRFGVYGSSNDRVNTLFTYGAGFGFYPVENFAIELEPYGMYVNQSRIRSTNLGRLSTSYNASAFGSNLNARWHFLATNQASMFLGAGFGGLWADEKVPYNGFESSLTENCELGASVALSPMVSLKGSFRYMHIGQFTNEGVSAYGGTVGVSVNF